MKWSNLNFTIFKIFSIPAEVGLDIMNVLPMFAVKITLFVKLPKQKTED